MFAESLYDQSAPSAISDNIDAFLMSNSHPISSAAIAAARAKSVQAAAAAAAATTTTTPATSEGSSLSIPSNPRGSHYDLSQVFRVWFENQDNILNAAPTLVPRLEYYKLAKPERILHLELDALVYATQREKNYAVSADVSAPNGALSAPARVNLYNPTPDAPLEWNDSPDFNPATRGVAPPGFENHSGDPPVVKLLQPPEIMWFYIDPANNEQGPFNGHMMQDWLTGGYLDMKLRIRRAEQTQFLSLKSFCESVRNFAQPFLVPLPPASVVDPTPVRYGLNATESQFDMYKLHLQHHHQSQDGQQIQSHMSEAHQQSHLRLHSIPQPQHFQPFVGGGGSGGPGQLGAIRLNTSSRASHPNLFGTDFIQSPDPFAPSSAGPEAGQFGMDPNLAFNPSLAAMPSLLQLQIGKQRGPAQLPALTRNNSSWLLEGSSGLLRASSPSTPISGHAGVAPSAAVMTPLLPWIATVSNPPRVSSPFVPQSLESELQKLDVKEPHDNGGIPPPAPPPTQPSQSEFKPSNGTISHEEPHVIPEFSNSVVNEILNDADEDLFQANAVSAGSGTLRPNHEAVPLATRASKKLQVVNNSGTVESPSYLVSPKGDEPIDDSASRVVNLKPAAAPEQKLAPWAAKTPVTEKPPMTLKEIQALEAERMEKLKQSQAQFRYEQMQLEQLREQEQMSSLIAAVSSSQSTGLPKTSSWAVPAPSASRSLSTQKTLAQIQREEAEAKAKSAKNSASAVPTIASTLAAVRDETSNYNPWQTVAPKKPAMKKTALAAAVITNASSASKLNPAVLRSVSAARPAPSTNHDQALREDCLVWARSALTNLYPSVSKNDLLDIFVSMPANLPDTSAVIAETIYALSATMDGRRFAQEFLKRKQRADQQSGSVDHAAWSQAVESSAYKSVTVDDDGWSTSNSKKKTKRPL